jgi:8-oxo-dGTP pyrophosphatase MutT (NUDIX family)
MSAANKKFMEEYEFPKAFSSYRKKYEEKCKKIKKPYQKIYGAIIENINTNQYLLVKGRESGKYSFPKGHIEPDETPIVCILRELYEETGIELVPSMSTIKMRDLIKSKIGLYLHCETTVNFPTCPQDTNEIEEVGWYSKEELKKLPLNADAGYYLKGMGVL